MNTKTVITVVGAIVLVLLLASAIGLAFLTTYDQIISNEDFVVEVPVFICVDEMTPGTQGETATTRWKAVCVNGGTLRLLVKGDKCRAFEFESLSGSKYTNDWGHLVDELQNLRMKEIERVNSLRRPAAKVPTKPAAVK